MASYAECTHLESLEGGSRRAMILPGSRQKRSDREGLGELMQEWVVGNSNTIMGYESKAKSFGELERDWDQSRCF